MASEKSINRYNVSVIQQSGKVGTVRYFQKGGKTYVRSAHNSVVTNPRSDKQMVQRLQFASRTALWSAMKGNLKNGFTNKTSTQSDFNAFMKLNDGRGVYFTKQQVDKGAQVIFPIQITDGKLESISCEKVSGRIKSGIALGSLVLDAATTVHALAEAIVANNDDFEYGDEIAFISILQTVNGENIPKIKGNFYRIVLTKGDSRLVHSLVSADGFQSVEGYLGTNADMPVGCFAYVHSRRDSKLLISSQTLVNNNEALIATYTSDTQYALARKSYGNSEQVFLDPNSGAVSTIETELYYIGVGYAEGCTSAMGSLSGSGSYEAGAPAVIKATANEGYRFVKWDDNNTSAERSITVAEEHNYLATFEAEPSDTATITVTSNDAQKGSVSIDGGEAGASATKTVAKGTQVSLSATAAQYCVFRQWSDESDDNPHTVTVNEDMSLTGTFETNV